MAAPETSGLRCATQARFSAWRVAKLSEQSSTTVAEPTSAIKAASSARDVTGITSTSSLIAARAAWPETALGDADARRRVEDLALQVGEVDVVAVHQRDARDTGRREVERGRRAQSPRSDHQHR